MRCEKANWKRGCARAREIVEAKLPKRTREVLAMPGGERRKLIAVRKKELAKRGKSA